MSPADRGLTSLRMTLDRCATWKDLPTAPPTLRSLTSAALATLKPVSERLKTGFATLDAATRGGIPLGSFIVFAGAPGAAKTTSAVWMANAWEKSGALVTYIAADEPAAGIVMRIAQLSQYVRGQMERADHAGDAARESFARSMERRHLYIVDPDTRDSDLEGIGALALKEAAAEGRPCVIVIDSIQTVKCGAAQKADNPREKINAVVAEAKKLAKRGAIVVALSEMSRSGYRDPSNRISALSASKESGAIEYGVSLLLGLTSVADEAGIIEIETAKNRLGAEKPTFLARLDFERASLSEAGTVNVEDRRLKAEAKRSDEVAIRIREAVTSRPGLKSRNQIIEVAKINRNDAGRVMDAMLADGTLRKGPNGFECP